MFKKLKNAGFDCQTSNHAEAIIQSDFKAEFQEIEIALLNMSIPIEELIGSGGGEAQSTQRLRKRLYKSNWNKHNFDFQLTVDGQLRVSTSHEVDHVRRSAAGIIACEIEWNNKDPFFDRDLENFQRLHAQTAISVGIIITRGASLQNDLNRLIANCIRKHGFIDDRAMVQKFGMKDRTKRQRDAVKKLEDKQMPFAEAFTKQFVSDKFGSATTHWDKLIERLDRGVGNPCPLVLIGLPTSIVKI